MAIKSLIVGAKRAIDESDEDADLVAWNLQTRADAVPGHDPCGDGGSISNGRKRNLYGRQSCELPEVPGGGPNPRGPVIFYRPGPPAPLCTANCGKLCSGFFCVPAPTGTPPDFESSAPTPTTTAGNTGNGDNGFPTLTSAPDTTAPPGQVCLSSKTATECNGGLHRGICITSTKCASFGQPPPNTNYISCSHRNQNPGQGIYTAFCVCDGSTFAESLGTAVTPYNSCAYTEKPTSTEAIKTGFSATTNMDTCQVCTRVSPNQQDCSILSNCTPKPTTPPSNPSTPVEPEGQAGGWYADKESLTCTNICEQLNKCVLTGAPSDGDIAEICKQVTDDCADGMLSEGRRGSSYGINGILGINDFAAGKNNDGCPNNDDCKESFEYIAANMRNPSALGFPNAYCENAFISINSHASHLKTGPIIVKYPSIRMGGP